MPFKTVPLKQLINSFLIIAYLVPMVNKSGKVIDNSPNFNYNNLIGIKLFF